jgi:peptidoglycan glycosyltransferase
VVERFGDDTWRRVMSGESAAAMRQLMIASSDYGYAQAAQVDGMTVGGKTGTAELGEGEPHSWFTGFAEVDDRALVAAVIVEHGGPGSQAALPIGRALLEAALAP